MGTGSLAVVISGATLLLVVIVVAPFALCCFFRRRKRDEESNPLLESNLPAISSKPVKRDSYGGASRLSPTESYPPLTSVPADAPTTSSKYAQSVRRKYELGGKTEQNSQQVIPPQASAPAEAPNTDIVAIHEKSTQSVRSKNRLGGKMDKNAQALGELQKRKCEDLEDGAAGFSSLADQLVAKKKKRKKSSRTFDADSHFTMRAIDRLKALAGISVIEELVQHSEVHLSHGDKEQGGESSVTELRAEELLEHDEQADKIHQLEKENEHLQNDIYYLRAESKGLVPVKQELKVEPGYQDVISRPHLPTEVLSQPKESINSFDLPGVEVVASTCVTVTNLSQTFHWVGYGFKLTIPQGSLPAGVDQCRLDIKASIAGQYQFPDNLQLVSSVFWMRPYPSGQFQQQLTVEIQHCAKMISSTKLSFVRAHCSQESLPYTFKQLEGRGSFTEHISYGSLELNHFSGLAVTGEDVEKHYTASLYYYPHINHATKIDVVLSWNDEAHVSAVEQMYEKKRAEKGSHLAIEFEVPSEPISLDIPMPRGVEQDGWRIYPLVTPVVTKGDVDSFKPGKNVPSLQLKAKVLRHGEVQDLSYVLNLIGAREPKNKLLVEVEPPENTNADSLLFSSNRALLPSEGLGARELLMHYPPSLEPPHYPVASHSRNMSEFPPSPHTSLTLSSATPPPPPHWNTRLQQWSHTGPLHPAIIPQPTATIDELVNHVGINKDLLNQPCSTEHLAKVAHLVPNWQKYAIALGVNEPHILSISSNSLLDPEMKAQQVLSLWKQTNGFKATYSVLVDMCLQKKDVQLAECICNIVKEDSSQPPPITGEKREATEHTEQGPSDKRPCLNTASEDTLELD